MTRARVDYATKELYDTEDMLEVVWILVALVEDAENDVHLFV